MVLQDLKRQAAVTEYDYTTDVGIGFNLETSSAFYIPLRYRNFEIPDLTVTGTTTVSASATIQGSAGVFDTLKIGDRVTAVSAGALGTLATVARDCNQIVGTNKLIYDPSFTSTTLGVKAGDQVSGGDVPSGAVVEYIDYSERTIYLSDTIDALTDDALPVAEITFTAPCRVTAVRKSTASANANQIDVTPAIATGASNVTLTVEYGATEAVFGVLRIVPIDSPTSQVRYAVDIAYLPGTSVKPSDNGLNGITPESYNYTNLGTAQFNGDRFLLDAGLPRPTS